MKKVCVILAILTFLFSIAPTDSFADETGKEKLFIVHGDHSAVMEYLDSNGIERKKTYESFPIILAELTPIEKHSLEQHFPDAKLISDHHYQQQGTPGTMLATTQATSVINSAYTGKNVRVAVLDSGIDPKHSALKVKGGVCTLTFDCPENIGYMDDNGHGTHIAGIIAAQKNTKGANGIAPNVDLYAIKALNAYGFGTTSSLLEGINWAITHKIDILNLSITTENGDPALQLALDKAYKAGVLIVGASGNNGDTSSNSVLYPGKYESVIAVGAVDRNSKKLIESAIGPEVELAAPGRSILSTFPYNLDADDDKKDGYTSLSGTSMAAAHVTGVLALYKERFPEMTNAELRKLLGNTAMDLGEVGRDPLYGFGLAQYSELLPFTANFKATEEIGKITLASEQQNIVSVTSGDKQILPRDGKWAIYGVAGQKDVLITTKNSDGKMIVEQRYLQFSGPTYTDMKNSQRFAESIGYLSNRDLIYGYNDGTFRPQSQMKRSEAAALIGRALGYSDEKRMTMFPDVPQDSIASGFIHQAVEEGIISGFPDGTFRPDQYVTRAEMSLLLEKAFGIKATGKTNFKDVYPGTAAFDAIHALAAANITEGFPDNTFHPDEKMKRGDFAIFLMKAQIYRENQTR